MLLKKLEDMDVPMRCRKRKSAHMEADADREEPDDEDEDETSLLVKSDNTVLAILHSHTSRKIIDPMLFVRVEKVQRGD